MSEMFLNLFMKTIKFV